MGDNKDSTGLIILGIVLGAILAFVLLDRRTQTLQQTQSIQSQPVQWQPIDIPRVEDIKPIPQTQTDSQLIQMSSQLEKATSQLEQATSKLQETVSRLQNRQETQPQPQVIVQPVPMYQSPLPIYQPYQTPVIVQPLQEQNIQNNQNSQQYNQQQISDTLYKNNEKWEIIRGSDGRIKSLNIIRDVKKNSTT